MKYIKLQTQNLSKRNNFRLRHSHLSRLVLNALDCRINPAPMTFIVGEEGDSEGPGIFSLRQAINDANDNPGVDTIEFKSDYFDTFHRIQLLSDLPLLEESVTILGTTAEYCVIDGTDLNPGGTGKPAFSMFHAKPNSNPNILTSINLTIDNLTFQNAKSSANG